MCGITRSVTVFSLLGVLNACTGSETITSSDTANANVYSEPSRSGLLAGNSYPTVEDVCVSLDSNSVTKPFEADGHFLIACPKHELGAIKDRESQQNAKVVGAAKQWVVMIIPVT